MDNKYLEDVKALYKRHLQEDLDTLETIDSFDSLATLMFGVSHVSLYAFHCMKNYVETPKAVLASCTKIQEKYLKIKSSE